MSDPVRKYCPSNGTDGMRFEQKFCFQCEREKFVHTNNHLDAQCEILSKTIIFEVKDEDYPSEWTYDDKGRPVCTAFKKWDWGSKEDGLNDPEIKDKENPNQLNLF